MSRLQNIRAWVDGVRSDSLLVVIVGAIFVIVALAIGVLASALLNATALH